MYVSMERLIKRKCVYKCCLYHWKLVDITTQRLEVIRNVLKDNSRHCYSTSVSVSPSWIDKKAPILDKLARFETIQRLEKKRNWKLKSVSMSVKQTLRENVPPGNGESIIQHFCHRTRICNSRMWPTKMLPNFVWIVQRIPITACALSKFVQVSIVVSIPRTASTYVARPSRTD